MYMLDTDIASHVIRGTSARLDQRIRAARPGSLCISVITRAELLLGVALKPGSQNLARVVEQFLSAITSLPWNDAAASGYAQSAAQLQQTGKPIGTMDALIAAHALAVNAVLVTHNTRHFSRIPGLRVEDWLGAGP
jgi:tRNA(fMet)-specific endonuclease VapC